MKSFLKIFGLIAFIIIVGLVVVAMSLNGLVKAGVETMGPQILGVPVTIEDVDISLLSGENGMQASLLDFVIKNPKGYETAYAFSLPTMRVKIDRDSVLTNTILVEEIVIDGPAITFEGSLLGSNIGEIQDNVKRNTQSAPQESTEESNEEATTGNDEKRVQISRVIVKNAQLKLSLMGLEGQTIQVTLPDIELHDIGKQSNGTSFQGASAAILNAVYGGVIKAVTTSGRLIPKGLDDLGETGEDLGKAAEKVGKELLKGLFKE